MVTVKTSCHNSNCPQRERVWYSQPKMPGTRIPAGNFLLSFAILVAGGSASKTLQILKHMGLSSMNLSTFFKNQRICLLVHVHTTLAGF